MKPRVAIDLDGVCYDWGGTVRYLMRTHFGYDLPPSPTWDFVQESISPEAWKWLWSEGVTEYGLFRYGNRLRGTVDGLRALRDAGYVLEVVTHRPRAALKDTLRFVGDGLPDVFSGFHFLSDGEPKSSVGCDVYLDDAPHVIEEVLNAGKRAVIFDQPWNETHLDPSGTWPDHVFAGALDGRLVRAHGWEEVPDAVAKTLGRPAQGVRKGDA